MGSDMCIRDRIRVQKFVILKKKDKLLIGDKAFVAGADISEMASMTPIEGKAFSALGLSVARALEELPIPVIAAVNGYALGGGIELALACDMIVASEKARFGQPEINLGVIPGFGGTQRLTRRIGLPLARELIYTGEMIDAEKAERYGLVNRVVAHDDCLKEAKALVDDAPNPLKEGVTKQEAEEIQARLTEAGGSVEIK